MKKNPHIRIILVLLTALLQQSCFPGMMVEGSVDLVKHKFKGPSYSKDNPDGSDLGLNIAAFYMVGEDAFNGPGLGKVPATPGILLADTRRQLSFESTTVIPKPSSLFSNPHFALMPGVQLIRKGNKYSDSFGTDVTRLLYLELPVYALYRHPLPDNKGEVFGGLGPYFALGLSGKSKYTFNSQTSEFAAFGNNGIYKRFDAGLALTAGYQFTNSVRLRLSYEWGLINIESNAGDDKTFNRALSLNVGYPISKIADKFKK